MQLNASNGEQGLASDRSGLVDAALTEAARLSSDPAFRATCKACQAGNVDEEAVKRAFRSVWWRLERRFDDFGRLLANARARIAALSSDQLACWAQAAAVLAALERSRSERLQVAEAAEERRRMAVDIAEAALRFAEAAAERR